MSGVSNTPSVAVNGSLPSFVTPVGGSDGSVVRFISTDTQGRPNVNVVGHAGGIMDAAGQNVASPASELLVAGQFNTTPTTITTGNVSPLQLDNAGNLLVDIKASSLTDPAECAIATTSAPAKILIAGGKSADGTPVFNPIPLAAGSGSVVVSGALTQSGNWTSRIVGNIGGVMDFAGQNAAAPANALLIGGEFNTTPTTIVSGNASPFQLDSAGNLLVNIKAGSSGNSAASATGSAVPASADYQGVKVGSNLVGVGGFTVGSITAEAVAIVDGSGNQITSFGGGTLLPDRTATGNLTAVSQSVAISTQGCGSLSIQLAGSFLATVQFQGTVDGLTWFSVAVNPFSEWNATGGAIAGTTVSGITGQWILNCGGLSQVRCFTSAYTSGTVAVTMEAGQASTQSAMVSVSQTNAGNLFATVNLQSGSGTAITSTASALDVNLKSQSFNPTTGSAPTAATVGVASASAVASNASRKGLVLTNTSANTISLGFGNAAVLNSGITLAPGGSFSMDAYNFTTAVVNAIASSASSNLAIQEWT